MMRLQLIVRLVLCCSLCLTVCAAPVLAANNEFTDGFFVWTNNASLMFNGSESINVLNGYFPASFSSANQGQQDIDFRREFTVLGSSMSHSERNVSLFSDANIYVEVLFSAPNPMTVTIAEAIPPGIPPEYADQAKPAVAAFLDLVDTTDIAQQTYWNPQMCQDVDFVVDSNITKLEHTQAEVNRIVPQTFDVDRYWGYRFNYPAFNVHGNLDGTEAFLKLYWTESYVNYTFTNIGSDEPIPDDSIIDQIVINTGVLREINGNVEDIKITTSQMSADISDIKGGLQDSNGSIWGAFKDSLSGLFVPSADDLTGVKDGFDQLAHDKLGGAYQTVELVDNGVNSVVNKFKNPGSSPGVEFPGISVPLGGDVGTVTLAASQIVTIPDKIKNVLYPVSSVIIPIVSVIWTIRQCLEMVEYFMSGMSYAEYQNRYLHEEDD